MKSCNPALCLLPVDYLVLDGLGDHCTVEPEGLLSCKDTHISEILVFTLVHKILKSLDDSGYSLNLSTDAAVISAIILILYRLIDIILAGKKDILQIFVIIHVIILVQVAENLLFSTKCPVHPWTFNSCYVFVSVKKQPH